MRKQRAAALLLALAAGFCLAGCEEEKPEEEPAPTFETRRLITAQGAAVGVVSTPNERMENGGLLVEGDGVSYTGAFNAVFENDLEISFGFCRGDPAAYRCFTLTFASASDPEKTFSVVYESDAAEAEAWYGEKYDKGCSGVYVMYGEEVRSTRYWKDKGKTEWYHSKENFPIGQMLASPMFGGAGDYETEFGELHGTLRLTWTSTGILEIYASERFLKDSPRLIAAFDGSMGGIGFDPSLKLWGLPRMEISDGYTVSFRSEVFGGYVTEPNAPDVYFSQFVTGRGSQERTYSLASQIMYDPPFYAANGTKSIRTAQLP